MNKGRWDKMKLDQIWCDKTRQQRRWYEIGWDRIRWEKMRLDETRRIRETELRRGEGRVKINYSRVWLCISAPLSFYLFVNQSIYLSARQPATFWLSISLSVCLFICLSVYPSIYLSICFLIYLSPPVSVSVSLLSLPLFYLPLSSISPSSSPSVPTRWMSWSH